MFILASLKRVFDLPGDGEMRPIPKFLGEAGDPDLMNQEIECLAVETECDRLLIAMIVEEGSGSA